MKTRLLFFAIILLLSSCTANKKLISLMSDGSVVPEEFIVSFQYEKFNNWIVIPVQLNNSNKVYNFLLDTGAPNVVSKEVAKELGLEALTSHTVGSATGQKQKTDFTRINSLKIGRIEFKDMGAVMVDFESSSDMECLGLKVDGFIGSNLMRKAIWRIDYPKKTIQITNSRKSLPPPNSKPYILPFTPTLQGTPMAECTLGSVKARFEVDTGKRGGLSLSMKKWKDLLAEYPNMPYVQFYGQTSSGMFGVSKDTAYQAPFMDVDLGTLNTKLQIRFRNVKKGLLGNTFLKQFIVIFDWQKNEIVFQKTKEYAPKTTFSSFGFSYFFKDNKLFISSLIDNSPATKAKLEIGDEIISVNGKAVQDIALNDYCRFLRKGLYSKEATKLELIVKNNDQPKSIVLEKKKFY